MKSTEISKLIEIDHKYTALERKISDPEVISDQKQYQILVKQHTELRPIVEVFRRFRKIEAEIKDIEELIKDPEMKALAELELDELQTEMRRLQGELQAFLIPVDPNDNKNAIVEIRSGTGGEEAALFAEDLFRMYCRYADKKGWQIEILSQNITEKGGIKEVVFVVSGYHVVGSLKFEMGTHRVQRVPITEASGRVHTSAATVAVLPEAEDFDVEIHAKDLRIDTFRASGSGGQHVNKTDSAIRITHLPTQVVVACQDERSQFQNKEKAMRILRARLYELEQEERKKREADVRKSQIGSGDRSEKIRTYNFPQNRVTDHRINLTLYSLDKILEGDMRALIEALVRSDQLEKMNA